MLVNSCLPGALKLLLKSYICVCVCVCVCVVCVCVCVCMYFNIVVKSHSVQHTVLTMLPVQWHHVHSRYCATLTIIHIPKFFTFLN